VMQTIAFIVIADLFPPAQRARFQGLFGSVFGLASIVGPALGGFLTDSWGWRWVFYLTLPVRLLALAAILAFLPHFPPSGVRPAIAYPGVAALILWVVPLLLALSWGGTQSPWGSPQILGLLAFATVMAVLFVAVERRAIEPILSLALFRSDIYSVSSAV